jgi:drug/metabolite transporter (DMT)-like permease
MGEGWGVLAAILSSGLGGSCVGATRYLAGVIDPLAIGSFRFGIGCALLLLVAAFQKAAWPPRRDWPGVAGLGLLFYGLFPVLFNASLIFTTAARGGLALSTMPVLTMAVGAALGVEPLTRAKTAGVLISVAGVAVALLSGLASAPPGAWLGDLLMIAAAFCAALYTVWSRPFIRRSGAIPFTAMGMAAGAAFLIAASSLRGSFAPVPAFGAPQWLAILWLGVVGGALTFYLWVFALGRTSPTRVAISATVNPVTASLAGLLLLGEAVRWNLVAGIVAVFLGIWIATRSEKRARRWFAPFAWRP